MERESASLHEGAKDGRRSDRVVERSNTRAFDNVSTFVGKLKSSAKKGQGGGTGKVVDIEYCHSISTHSKNNPNDWEQWKQIKPSKLVLETPNDTFAIG